MPVTPHACGVNRHVDCGIMQSTLSNCISRLAHLSLQSKGQMLQAVWGCGGACSNSRRLHGGLLERWQSCKACACKLASWELL